MLRKFNTAASKPGGSHLDRTKNVLHSDVMKTLGLIGGTTWVSTVDYYRYLNQITNERLSGLSSARLLLYSVDFGELMEFVNADDWQGAGEFLSVIAVKLEAAGAEGIMLCANTTHITAEIVRRNISIPVLHIVDAVAAEIERQNMKKVGLLGTRFTMEREFFREGLASFGIEAIIPDTEDREFIHWSIYNELGKDIFTEVTRQKYLEVIERLSERGAEGVILGCTEIPMLIKPDNTSVQLFDTTFIHAKYAVDFALSN